MNWGSKPFGKKQLFMAEDSLKELLDGLQSLRASMLELITAMNQRIETAAKNFAALDEATNQPTWLRKNGCR